MFYFDIYTWNREYYIAQRDYKLVDTIGEIDRCQVSTFLQSKLSIYTRVEHVRGHMVWIVHNTIPIVIKMFLDRETFENTVKMQLLLENHDLGCKLLDTWINEAEYFTISVYGGPDLKSKWNSDYLEKVTEIKRQLANLGLRMKDDHLGNFVIDATEKVRVIDYESILPILMISMGTHEDSEEA